MLLLILQIYNSLDGKSHHSIFQKKIQKNLYESSSHQKQEDIPLKCSILDDYFLKKNTLFRVLDFNLKLQLRIKIS
jgi:hypothetical protein